MYFIVPCLVIFSFHPRRAPQCRHVTKIPSPQLLLFPPLANRDARNSFRFRSYANCRVTSFKPKAFSLFEPFPSGPSNLPTFFLSDLLSATPSQSPPRSAQFCWYLSSFRMNTSKSVSKQMTVTTFRMNTYEKQGEGSPVLVNQKSKRRPLAQLLRCFITSHFQLPPQIRNNHLPENHRIGPHFHLSPQVPALRIDPRLLRHVPVAQDQVRVGYRYLRIQASRYDQHRRA